MINPLDVLKNQLKEIEHENKEETSAKIKEIINEIYEQHVLHEELLPHGKAQPRLEDLFPLEELVQLLLEHNIPLPTGITAWYSKESSQECASEESSIRHLKEITEDRHISQIGGITHTKEFDDTLRDKLSSNVDDITKQISDEEEESFDSDKEFDDYRFGDENWTEPRYSNENFVAQPIYYDRNVFRINALQFNHSLGYDSNRRENLCLIDKNTIIYLSGNYIHVYNVSSRTFKYIRGSGLGLGHCAKHPHEPIFAVGERGIQPVIIIYDYPSLNVLRVLRGGADEAFNYVCFSPNGKWLLSQASKPDSSLTLWNWNMERIVLKVRNVDREVWKAIYNPYESGRIIATGPEHITFWNLVETFTGLKLLSTPGKWGDRTFCDINTICPLPNDTVISSNYNNTLYVWGDDMILMEVLRRNNRPLHNEGIVYLEYKKKYDELFSVGLEGKYKVWDFTRIERAKRKCKNSLEIQPTFQRKIQDEFGVAKPISFQKLNPNDPNSEMYYMQDKEGCIWLVELAVKESLAQSKRVLNAHSGPILDLAPSPAGYYVATIGTEGKLHVYNSKINSLVMKMRLSVAGTSLLWLPLELDKTASILVIGFIDGTIRLAVLSIPARELNPEKSDADYITIIQAFKPHNDVIKVLSVNPPGKYQRIVLSGSDDCRIFMYTLIKYKQHYLRLSPIGFISLPGPIYFLAWSKTKEAFLTTTLIGTITEVIIPENIPEPSINSFEIKLPMRTCNFKSVKSELERNVAIGRNLKKKEQRKVHQERKRAYESELWVIRKKKIDELNEIVNKIQNEKELATKKLKDERIMLEKAKSEAEKILKQSHNYKASSFSSDDDEGGKSEKIPIRYCSDSERVSNRTLDIFQQLLNERMLKKEFVNKVETPVVDKSFETEAKELVKIIKELKKSYQDEKDDLKSIKSFITSSGESNSHLKMVEIENKFKNEEMFIDEIILDELAKILEEEISFDDLEAVSEDEAVPPRHRSSGSVPIYFADYINDDCIWVSPGGYDAGYIYEYELGTDEPYKCTPIVYFENIEMTCFTLVNGGYLIIGQGNGFLKVIQTNPDNFSDFSKYWLYGMHDNINGKIKKICLTYDYRFLYSIGEDSNIFFYNVNLTNTKCKEKKNLFQLMLPPHEMRINHYIGENEPSLEDSVKQAEKDWLINKLSDSKATLQEKLKILSNKFQVILSLNSGLPESQRLPLSYFVVNEEYYNRSLQLLLDKKQQQTKQFKLEFEKAKVIRNQIYNYFLNSVQTFKIYIYAHSFYCKVTTFYQTKLSDEFLMAEKEVGHIIMDILEKGRKKFENISIPDKSDPVGKKYISEELEIKPFFSGEDRMLMDMSRFEKSVYTRITKQRKRRHHLQNLLKIFNDRSDEKRKQFSGKNYKSKILKDVPFRLKCDPSYKISQNFTKETKFYQLVTTKRKIDDLMTHFNTLTLKAREMKSQAAALLNSCKNDVEYMTFEFKNIVGPTLPKTLQIFESLEFPETIYLDNPPIFPHETKIPNTYQKRLFHQLYEVGKTFPVEMSTIQCGVNHEKHSTEYNPWEMEFIFERRQVLMSEYIKKQYYINDLIKKYDNEIKKLAFMKVEFEVKITYLKVCYHKYFEELQVVQTFQLLEEDIDQKCSIFIKQKHIHILRINVRNRRIEKCKFDIVRCIQRCQLITTRFVKEIAHHPASMKQFVMKYFDKTWSQEQKAEQPDASSEEDQQQESSSSDTDSEPPEAEEDEIDSDDIDRLVKEQQETYIGGVDETNQEEKCGKDLIDYTLETREKRFTYERRIEERKKEINVFYDQIKKIREKVLIIDTIIAIFKVKKSLTVEEKHKQLNKIRTVVVLDSSQMQHFDASTNSFPPTNETILFSIYTLKNLESKKRNLKNKMITVRLDEKETLKHVKRLELDIGYLKTKLQNIKDEIRREKIDKFGYDINLPRMEETILRRIIKDYKYNTLPFHIKFHFEITKLQEELRGIKRSAGEHIKQNTFEQLQYGALLEQKRQYREIMRKNQNKKQVQYLTREEIDNDNEKLRILLQIQERFKETIASMMNKIHFPGGGLGYENFSLVRKKMMDDLLGKNKEISDSENEDRYEKENKTFKMKPLKKVKTLKRNSLSVGEDLSEDFAIPKNFLIKSYKTLEQENEEELTLDFMSDEEIKEPENEELQEESDESYYGE